MDPLSPKQLRSLNEAYGSIRSSEEEALKEELLREEKESIDILFPDIETGTLLAIFLSPLNSLLPTTIFLFILEYSSKSDEKPNFSESEDFVIFI